MNLIASYLKDFFQLIFPEICHSCGNTLVETEQHFCTSCLYELPYTHFHLDAENKLAKQFWGRIRINSAVAFLYFTKGGKVQNIMHQLKYNQQPQIGVELGRLYAKELKNLSHYKNAEAIIPVPLHSTKLKKRGYNQSEQFALGLAEVLEIPVLNDILFRVKSAESQTSKSRDQRFDNIKAVFEARTPNQTLKKIILVDDTITTGATLEMCALALQNIGITEINIVGIAFTE